MVRKARIVCTPTPHRETRAAKLTPRREIVVIIVGKVYNENEKWIEVLRPPLNIVLEIKPDLTPMISNNMYEHENA